MRKGWNPGGSHTSAAGLIRDRTRRRMKPSAADLLKRRLGIADTSTRSAEETRPAREEETQPLTNAAGLITDPAGGKRSDSVARAAGALSAAIAGDTSTASAESVASLLKRELDVLEGRNE